MSTIKTTIDQLRDLKGRVETFGTRRTELERLKIEIESKNDFTLGAAEVALFAETAAGVQLATNLEKSIRPTLAKNLAAAANSFSGTVTRIQNLHREIDAEIQKRVIATLPTELAGVEVITGPMTVDVHGAFAGKVDVAPKLHIKQSKLGQAESAARLDPLDLSARGYFDPGSTLPTILQVLDAMIQSLEKVDAEEARAAGVLDNLRKVAAKAA